MLLGAPAAYALARFEFRGKADLWFWFISNRMISPIVMALPVYLLSRRSGARHAPGPGPHLPDVLPPIAVWICTDQFRSIPRDLEPNRRESRGPSQFDVFWRIYLPLGIPGMAVSAIFAFIFSWNELLYALVLITSQR